MISSSFIPFFSRIRFVLGILEPDTIDSKNEDEILSELKGCQQELKAISKQNGDVLKQLLNVAKEEMKKQEIRKKLDSANTEVGDSLICYNSKNSCWLCEVESQKRVTSWRKRTQLRA